MNHPVHWYLENNVLDHLKRNGHFVKGVTILTKTEMVKEILQAGSACQELKTAAQNYLDAVGTADEQDKAETLVAECEADVMKCADVIVFMKTDAEKKHLGAEVAAGILAHEEELLSKGIEYCDCPGCTAGKRVMDNKALFLA